MRTAEGESKRHFEAKEPGVAFTLKLSFSVPWCFRPPPIKVPYTGLCLPKPFPESLQEPQSDLGLARQPGVSDEQ